MAERPDYYAVLGVGRDASDLAVRAAYRRLVLNHHPDRHPDDPAATTRLKHLVEAYETLGNETQRGLYDAGTSTVPPVEPGAPWEELLGRVVDAVIGPRDKRPSPGRDHQYRLELTLKEAARGCTHSLQLPLQADCQRCEGRGFPLEIFPTICPRCQGAGGLEQRRTLRRVVEICEECDAKGFLVTQPCTDCAGSGARDVRRAVTIDVPAGVSTGAKLVVRGAGQPGVRGGEDGDCFVIVAVGADPVLTVVGRDVMMTRPVTAFQAIAGGWISVPTLDGARRLRLPSNSLNGRVLRMTGLGVGAESGDRGDQLVTLDIEYPQRLDEPARDTLSNLGARLGPEAFPRTSRFEGATPATPDDAETSDP